MSQTAQDPKELLSEGATRAKNMGVAVAMIAFLLAKYFVVKIVWKRLERVIAIVVVKTAVFLHKLYERSKPHIERFKVMADQTKNKVVRVALGLLIVALTPLENALLRFFGIAKAQSEKLAVVGTTSLIVVVVKLFSTMGAAVKGGLSKPAMQRMVAKLFDVLEEAQKA